MPLSFGTWGSTLQHDLLAERILISLPRSPVQDPRHPRVSSLHAWWYTSGSREPSSRPLRWPAGLARRPPCGSTFLLLPAEPCLPVALSHQKADHRPRPQPTLVCKRRSQIQSLRSAVGSILPRPPDGIFEHFTWSVISNWPPGFAQALGENAKNSIFFLI